MMIASVFRYPVKSLLGEELTEAAVTSRGLRGDRRLALLDLRTGKVASAKYPRRWRELLRLSARARDGVEITGPDGLRLRADDPAAGAVLSELLGRPVALIAEPPADGELDRAVPEEVLANGVETEVAFTVSRFGAGSPARTFFDYAPVHLLTTATLDRIAELSPRGAADCARYRPNLLIDSAERGFAENAWAGRELLIGPEVRLRVTIPTPRCAVPTLAHGELPRDPDALRVLATANRIEPLPGLGALPCAGMYAEVLRPGRIRQGDAVRFA